MPQSLARVLLHLVFSTKHRTPFLSSPDLRERVNGYLLGTLNNLDCPSLIVNCVADHVHCLCHLSRTIAIARLVQELKTSSSVWIKQQSEVARDFQWQAGYGAFSVSVSSAEPVRMYIAGQAEHHHRMSYQDEFRELLRRHGVVWDERYVWD